MSQKKVSVKVPEDLLPVARRFHTIREQVNAEVRALNEESRLLQERLDRENKRLSSVIYAAATEMTRAIAASKIISSAETPFYLNTEFLDDHGLAFILTDPSPEDIDPTSRTKH